MTRMQTKTRILWGQPPSAVRRAKLALCSKGAHALDATYRPATYRPKRAAELRSADSRGRLSPQRTRPQHDIGLTVLY